MEWLSKVKKCFEEQADQGVDQDVDQGEGRSFKDQVDQGVAGSASGNKLKPPPSVWPQAKLPRYHVRGCAGGKLKRLLDTDQKQARLGTWGYARTIGMRYINFEHNF